MISIVREYIEHGVKYNMEMEQMHDRGKEKVHASLMQTFPCLRKLSNADDHAKEHGGILSRLQKTKQFAGFDSKERPEDMPTVQIDVEMNADMFTHVLQGTRNSAFS